VLGVIKLSDVNRKLAKIYSKN